MSGELAHDMHVVVGEAEGWRLRRPAEPRPTGRDNERLRVHAHIITGRDAAMNTCEARGPDQRNYECAIDRHFTGKGSCGALVRAQFTESFRSEKRYGRRMPDDALCHDGSHEIRRRDEGARLEGRRPAQGSG